MGAEGFRLEGSQDLVSRRGDYVGFRAQDFGVMYAV